MRKLNFILLCSVLLTSCVFDRLASIKTNTSAVELLAHVKLNLSAIDSQYPFRGISGLDYNHDLQLYFAISDDKGKYGPARFYSFGLGDKYQIIDVKEVPLTNNNAEVLNATDLSTEGPLDPEAIRYHPDGYVVWSSENGHVYITDLSTSITDEFILPDYISFTSSPDWGARKNKFVEGISFTPDFKYIMFALEAPLKQDADLPTISSGSFTRILVYEFLSRTLISEYLYPLNSIFKQSIADPPLQDNGVSEILALNENTVIVVERSGSHLGNYEFEFENKIFIAKLESADNIMGVKAIRKLKNRVAAKKHLLISLAEVISGIQPNIESITLGEDKQGRRMIYMMSDDGFHNKLGTELIVLSIDSDFLVQVFN